MSKKKSLGSSPIGFHSENSSMQFIPDLGVSKPKSMGIPSQKADMNCTGNISEREHSKLSETEKPKKKIVSYNLEVDLIETIKSVANNRGLYYSTLVSKALKSWIVDNK